MLSRHLTLPDDERVLLFGPRGTGKTTLLKQQDCYQDALYLNLLNAEEENRFAKRTTQLRPEKLSAFKRLINDFGDAQAICLSQDPYPQVVDGIQAYPWDQGIKQYFT